MIEFTFKSGPRSSGYIRFPGVYGVAFKKMAVAQRLRSHGHLSGKEVSVIAKQGIEEIGILTVPEEQKEFLRTQFNHMNNAGQFRPDALWKISRWQ